MEYPPGCTCALVAARLGGYLRRTLSRLDALVLAEHLEACPPCAQRLDTLLRLTEGFRSGDAVPGV
jgi:hypothetical protein